MMKPLNSYQVKASLFPKNFAMLTIILLILFILSVVASIAFGSRTMSCSTLLDGLIHPELNNHETNIVRQRMVRTIFSFMCGAALGVSGALMQSITRNPVADPSILGVNTGAALFVVSGMTFFNIGSPNEYIWLAIAGAILTAIFVYTIGSLGGNGATPLKLVLAGAATSAILSSLVTALMIPRQNVVDQFRFWQVGSVGAGTWESIQLLLPFFGLGMLIAILTAPALNAMALGDEVAVGLGVKIGTIRLVSAFAGVLLCGATTALAGPIGFIGLLASHVIRMIIGANLRFVIPLSAITGGIILTVADVVGRLIARPGEVEVGILTAFIGAPILILITMKAKMRSL